MKRRLFVLCADQWPMVKARGKPGDTLAGLLGQIPPWASRNARAVLVVAGLVTVVLAAGMTQLRFEDNQIDLLPRGNPHTEAARNVSEAFPYNYFVASIDLVIDPDKWAAANAQLPYRLTTPQPYNVTDEVYIRAAEEFNLFFLEQVPSAVYNITLDSYVRLINYTNTGSCLWAELGLCAQRPDPRAFDRLPGTDPAGEQQFYMAWHTIDAVSHETIEATVGPSWNTTQSAFLFRPADGQTTAQVGREAIAGFEAYRKWAPDNARWDVWDLEASHFTTKDPVVIDAHTSEVTGRDVQILTPVVLVFILLALLFAFRGAQPILVAAATLAAGAVWSFGIMGYLDVPVNTLNLVLVPLILGNGIDYSIHVINEYLEHRSQGLDDHASFAAAGEGAGVPLFIATATTTSGLLVMAFSPSLLMAQVGMVSAIAMVAVFLLCLTFIPAALTVLPTGNLNRVFRPSRVMPRMGRAIARGRAPVALLVLAITAVAVVAGSRIETETYGTPALNFPEGDWLREQYDKENLYFFGTENPTEQWVTDFLVFEGDLTDPAFHDYLAALEDKLRESDLVRGDRVISIRYAISQWKAIEGGTAGAAVPLVLEEAQPDSTYPSTRQAIEDTLDSLFASPFSTYGALFINHPANDVAVMLLESRAGDTFDATAATWDGLWAIVAEVDRDAGRPEDVSVHMYGNTATAYLFVEEELPWLRVMAAAAFLVVTGLVFAFTRSLRPTLCVATLVGLTSIWWLGLLPAFGVGLSITLMLPMAFIMSIGSDYAVHLAWNLERAARADHVFATTGKSVMFSAVTDGGAFLIFTGMQYLLMQRAMVATSLAIGVIFAATVLVIPLFYPNGWGTEDAGHAPLAPSPVEAPQPPA